jgi:hypothetical protein
MVYVIWSLYVKGCRKKKNGFAEWVIVLSAEKKLSRYTPWRHMGGEEV